MGRMYTKGRGISASTLPYRRSAPNWITMSPSAVTELIIKLARKGTTNLLVYLYHLRSLTKSNWCHSQR